MYSEYRTKLFASSIEDVALSEQRLFKCTLIFGVHFVIYNKCSKLGGGNMPIYKMEGSKNCKQKYRGRVNYVDALGKYRQVERIV